MQVCRVQYVDHRWKHVSTVIGTVHSWASSSPTNLAIYGYIDPFVVASKICLPILTAKSCSTCLPKVFCLQKAALRKLVSRKLFVVWRSRFRWLRSIDFILSGTLAACAACCKDFSPRVWSFCNVKSWDVEMLCFPSCAFCSNCRLIRPYTSILLAALGETWGPQGFVSMLAEMLMKRV